MSDERLADILRRQERAAAQKRASDARAAEAQAEATRLELRAQEAWKQQSIALDQALAELNAVMLANGIQLHRRAGEAGKGAVDGVEVGFGDRPSSATDLKVLYFSIGADGVVAVRMGTADRMPAKQYGFDLLSAAKADWAGALLDFVDVNTP